MRPGETLIQMARRHVAEGEMHVFKQRQIIARLRENALPTETAEALLVEFEMSLADHHRSVGCIEEEQRLGLRDEAGNLIPGGSGGGLRKGH